MADPSGRSVYSTYTPVSTAVSTAPTTNRGPVAPAYSSADIAMAKEQAALALASIGRTWSNNSYERAMQQAQAVSRVSLPDFDPSLGLSPQQFYANATKSGPTAESLKISASDIPGIPDPSAVPEVSWPGITDAMRVHYRNTGISSASQARQAALQDPIKWVSSNLQWDDPRLAEKQIQFLRSHEKPVSTDPAKQGTLAPHERAWSVVFPTDPAKIATADPAYRVNVLANQILDRSSGNWALNETGLTAGGAAVDMARTLSNAGITDISQFGAVPGGIGNRVTGQRVSETGLIGQTASGNTKYGVSVGANGQIQFVAQTQPDQGGGLLGDLAPIVGLGLAIFAPGIGSAIGAALGATGVAASVIGSAIVQGVLADASGGNFGEGAIKGAISAGVAPAVANNVGSVVSDLMADSAFKNVITNAVASSASSAVTAALTGGDVESAALTGALAGAGGSIGRELGTAADLGTTPFSEQTQMLAGQEQGLGTAGGLGANIGQAAGAIAAGADADQAILQALAQAAAEKQASTPKTVEENITQTPVSPPPGAEITTVSPPETGQITDMGLMDGVAGTIPEITPPSTQEIPIPDQISQELGGVQDGIAGTIPSLDQELIDLITQPPDAIPEGLAPPDAIPELAPPDMGVQEENVETIPEDLSEDPLLGLSSAEVGLGEQEAIDRQALEGLSDASVGLGEEAAIDQANLDALGDLSSAEVGQGEQDAIDRQALEELSSAEVGQGEQDAIDAAALDFQTTPYIRDIYISSGRRQPVMGPTVTTLGQALAPPLFPSSPVSGLTSYRGAGEIESKSTGKPRRDVWNEASLRLKDALGL